MTTTTTTTTTMTNLIDNANKESSIDKALAMRDTIESFQGVKVKRTLDIQDAREKVKAANLAIEEFNALPNISQKLDKIPTTFKMIVTPNDKLKMTLTVTIKGIDATIGSIRLRREVDSKEWKEVKAFSVDSKCDSITDGQREFLTTVSKAAKKLIASYGLENMNTEKKAQTIICEKMKVVKSVLDKIDSLAKVEVIKQAV